SVGCKVQVLVLFFILVFDVWGSGEGVSSISIAPMEKNEREALYLAIQGFAGNWWNGSDLYPDPCGWTPIQGVSCDYFYGFWHITSLTIGPMYDNSLNCTQNATFNPQLYELRYLKSLFFFNCFLSPYQNPITIENSNWENFANTLESLEFRSNPGLIGTIPTTLTCLKNLQSLVLLDNGLTGKLPANIGNLIKLRRLVTAGNRLVGQIPASIGGMSELLIIDLSRNGLYGSILPSIFGNLTSLLKLDLSKNMLQGNLPREIVMLKNLTLLDLSWNKFSSGLTNSVEGMISLKELILSGNPVGGDLMSIEWKSFPNLEILEFSNMGLVGNIPNSMTDLRNLKFLGLDNNSLTGEIPPRLEELPSLHALRIRGNNFTGKLQFSKGFYEKLGRRFEAWNNPNLCYSLEMNSSDYVPYGVKPCENEEEPKEETGARICNQDSHFVTSRVPSISGVSLIWK
ncbi:Leucine-rich repeat, partial [Dillenia turbinata]